MTENQGFPHFLLQTDAVGWFVVAVLLVMSVASWYVIALKSVQLFLAGRRSRSFLESFRSWGDPDGAGRRLGREPPQEPFGRLARAGWEACERLSRPTGRRAVELESPEDFLAAALSHGVAAELAELEEGLAVLSSVAATAPFVGLFGTVWGIYHALMAIGATGQASLDQVAGAIGEALIMTGCGLAVAIPAVLGHNALSYAIGRTAGALERFGHELFGLFTLGSAVPVASDEPLPVMETAATESAHGL